MTEAMNQAMNQQVGRQRDLHVGKPMARNEDPRFLKGAGRYADDVHIDGMLHAAMFRSSWPHGRIRRIEIAEAAALPGVVGVFTDVDFATFLHPIRSRIASMPGFENFLQLPLATDKVRYVGEPMAVVVATSPYIAEDALALIRAEVDDLTGSHELERPRQPIPLIHERRRDECLERRGRPRRCAAALLNGAIRAP